MWGRWKDYKEYEKDTARFVTEFGFQAPPNLRTLESVTILSDLDPQSRVMEHHNKLPEGTERLYRFQAGHVNVGTDLADFIYKGQIIQAEALKTAVEHWRRRKFSHGRFSLLAAQRLLARDELVGDRQRPAP